MMNIIVDINGNIRFKRNQKGRLDEYEQIMRAVNDVIKTEDIETKDFIVRSLEPIINGLPINKKTKNAVKRTLSNSFSFVDALLPGIKLYYVKHMLYTSFTTTADTVIEKDHIKAAMVQETTNMLIEYLERLWQARSDMDVPNCVYEIFKIHSSNIHRQEEVDDLLVSDLTKLRKLSRHGFNRVPFSREQEKVLRVCLVLYATCIKYYLR